MVGAFSKTITQGDPVEGKCVSITENIVTEALVVATESRFLGESSVDTCDGVEALARRGLDGSSSGGSRGTRGDEIEGC